MSILIFRIDTHCKLCKILENPYKNKVLYNILQQLSMNIYVTLTQQKQHHRKVLLVQ